MDVRIITTRLPGLAYFILFLTSLSPGSFSGCDRLARQGDLLISASSKEPSLSKFALRRSGVINAAFSCAGTLGELLAWARIRNSFTFDLPRILSWPSGCLTTL